MQPQAPQVKKAPGVGPELVGILVVVLLLLELSYGVIPFVNLAGLLANPVLEVLSFVIALLILLLVWLVLRLARRPFERATRVRFGTHAQARSAWRLVPYLIWASLS